LTTFVLSNSADLDLSPESQIVLAVEQAKLSYMGELTLSRYVNCVAAGVFAINCTSYRVCLDVGGGIYIEAEVTCPTQQNFNPGIKLCDPDYVCPSCRREGFMCLTNTSFTLCSDAKEVVVWNVTCPSNHCCHEAYKLPCMSEKLTCLC
jgi:hypothetical protein